MGQEGCIVHEFCMASQGRTIIGGKLALDRLQQ